MGSVPCRPYNHVSQDAVWAIELIFCVLRDINIVFRSLCSLLYKQVKLPGGDGGLLLSFEYRGVVLLDSIGLSFYVGIPTIR